jgi:multiple sugar transport system substrate-binding protein
MKEHKRTLSRRDFLQGAAITAAGTILAACATPTPEVVEKQVEVEVTREVEKEVEKEVVVTQVVEVTPQVTPQLTYWLNKSFVPEANDVLAAKAMQWADDQGVEMEILQVQTQDLKTKLMAAIEVDAMPDIFGASNTVPGDMHAEWFLDISDVFQELDEELGGWVPVAAEAAMGADGKQRQLCYGLSGSMFYSRRDVLEPAGFDGAPDTWEQMAEWAQAAQNPPEIYGFGQPVGPVGDGNVFFEMVQAYGGRFLSDDAKEVLLDKPEYIEGAIEALGFLDDAYNTKRIFPPGVTAWDNTGNNNAYQSGQVIFVQNPLSIYAWMRENDQDLLENTIFSAMPAGPVHRVVTAEPYLRAIAKTTEYPELAKDLMKYLFSPEVCDEWYPANQMGPTLQQYSELPVWEEEPVMGGLLDIALNAHIAFWPDPYCPQMQEMYTLLVAQNMVVRVLVDRWDPERAIAEAVGVMEGVLEKYEAA